LPFKEASITKRPILHPAIPSPYAGSSAKKVVYVTAKTPFISAVKRVHGLLQHAQDRTTQGERTKRRNQEGTGRGGRQLLRNLVTAEIGPRPGHNQIQADDGEEVSIKATGKAIERALSLATWFQGQDGYNVMIKTGSVGAIDDIELPDRGDMNVQSDSVHRGRKRKREEEGAPQQDTRQEPHKTMEKTGDGDKMDDSVPIEAGTREQHAETQDERVLDTIHGDLADADENPESRVRLLSAVEVVISWR
jgi:ribonuclease P/MRP protein subunit POP7